MIDPDDPHYIKTVLQPRLIRMLSMSVFANIIFAIALTATTILTFNKQPLVIAVSDDGRAVQLEPVDKPMVNDSQVAGFSSECIRKAFSHDFINYRNTATAASDCFTREGNEGYIATIQPLFQQMTQNRYVMSEELIKPATVVRSGMSNGVYTWEVQAQMRLFREGAVTRMTPVVYDVSLKVQRVGVDANIRGISITELNVSPGRDA